MGWFSIGFWWSHLCGIHMFWFPLKVYPHKEVSVWGSSGQGLTLNVQGSPSLNSIYLFCLEYSLRVSCARLFPHSAQG